MNNRSEPMTKEERRKAMPLTTEVVDAFTAEFGPLDAIKATEAGHEIHWQKKPEPKA